MARLGHGFFVTNGLDGVPALHTLPIDAPEMHKKRVSHFSGKTLRSFGFCQVCCRSCRLGLALKGLRHPKAPSDSSERQSTAISLALPFNGRDASNATPSPFQKVAFTFQMLSTFQWRLLVEQRKSLLEQKWWKAISTIPKMRNLDRTISSHSSSNGHVFCRHFVDSSVIDIVLIDMFARVVALNGLVSEKREKQTEFVRSFVCNLNRNSLEMFDA